MSKFETSSMLSPMVQVDFSKLGTEPEVLAIIEEPFLGHINIRGRVSDKAFVNAVTKVLGGKLPKGNNTFSETKQGVVLWLGPDEWLVLTEPGEETPLLDGLKRALADTFCAVTDLTGGNTVLDISGSRATDTLLKGCPLDLHHSKFTTGQCAQTVMAKTGVTLYQYSDAPAYKIIIRRSFSDYLGTWLLDAAREWG